MPSIQVSQKGAHVKIICSGLEEVVVVKVKIYEKVSELFRIETIIQMKQQVDTSSLINKSACIKVMLPDNSERYFSGIIADASIENVPTNEKTAVRASNILCLTIVPTVFRLSLSKKYRIFQEMSAVEIIEDILKENGISNVKKSVGSAGSQTRVFCVQYHESDWYFISRLMEEEGIFYFFNHEQNGDVLYFSDNSSGAKEIKPNLVVQKNFHEKYTDMHAVYNISARESLGINKITSLSFNEDKFNPVSGSAEDSGENYKIGKWETFDFPFEDSSAGSAISKNILERENRITKLITCYSACPNMYTGGLCVIQGSSISSQNGRFFIVEAIHEINHVTNEEDLPFYENKLKLIPSDVRYRPPALHPKFRIYGTQTATVTGPSGEEVFCDEKGRIKVKFHWDTRGTKDDKSSCWIRVCQVWAGKNFGGLVTPRVNMEVLVAFINGDPDQPIVKGCLYNGVNVPPGDYPKSSKTVSTFYTDSSKGSGGFNELRFEDKKDNEEIFIHAQKDMNSVIENSVTETLNEGSKTVTLESKKGSVNHIILIKEGDYSTTINKGNMTIKLDNGNMDIEVVGDISIKAHNITVEASENITVSADKDIKISSQQNYEVNSNMKLSMSSKMDMSFESKMALSEKALNIKRNADVGISDKANANLTIESTATATLKGGAMTTVNVGATLKLGGGLIQIGG